MVQTIKSLLNRSIVLVALTILLTCSGFANVIPILEGSIYTLVNTATGNDINDAVLGGVGLCNPGGVNDLCNANTPLLPTEIEGVLDRSDIALWVAINNAAGVRIGTGILFCSDSPPDDGGDGMVNAPASWNNPVNCNNFPWANLNKFMFESRAVGGVETTPYTPGANDPGFLPSNELPTYNLVSDVPEPSSSILFLSGLGALWAKYRKFVARGPNKL